MSLTALALALLLQQDAYALKWTPKTGETHVYEMFLKDKETAVEAVVEHKVTDTLSKGSYKVRSRSLGALVRFGANEVRDDRPNEATATFDSYGRLGEIEGGSAGLEKYRNALLSKFVAPQVPVKVGDKWTYERDKDAPQGLAGVMVQYTLKAVKDGVAEVGVVFTERADKLPQTATGTWWINAKTGVPERFEAKVKNFVGSETPETEVRIVLRKPA